MPTWPSTLPQEPLQQGYEEARQSGVVRTQMDKGPPKARQRSSATVSRFQMRFRITGSQVATLESFFEDDLDYGALRFDWTHPRTGAAVQFRFREPYSLSQIAGDLYEVGAALEVLP